MIKIETAKIAEGYKSEIEDKVEIIELADGVVIVVADGAGGTGGGANAANTVVRIVRDSVKSIDINDQSAWCIMLAEIDSAIEKNRTGGETTAVAVGISANGIAGASIGDSEAWLITKNSYKDLTVHQQRKPLIGTGVAVPAPFLAKPFTDTLLVASDGLFKYANPNKICEIVRNDNIQNAVKQLVDIVRLKSGNLQDDVSIALCRPSL